MPIFPALGPAFAPASIAQRTQPYTLLPLDRFARIIQYSPLLFHGVEIADLQPPSSCSDPVLQYTWQPRSGGRPGREEFAYAIQQAEETIERALKFSPVPRWYVDDQVRPPRRPPTLVWAAPSTLVVKASSFHLIQGGVETWSLIEANASIVYDDRDGDGYKEYATVVVTTSVTDVDEISVYYPATSHEPSWEVRPIKVTISGGMAVIEFHRHLVVAEELIERLDAAAVNGLVDSNFLETVDVYRRYNSQSQMAQAEWTSGLCEVGPTPSVQTGYLTRVDDLNGIVRVYPATYDVAADTWTNDYCPCWGYADRVRLWYRAGYRDQRLARPMHEMHPELERAISYLALSYMDREVLSCEQLHNLQDHWRHDLAESSSSPSQSKSYKVDSGMLRNPFGTTRAAVYAWRVIQRLQVGEAVLD